MSTSRDEKLKKFGIWMIRIFQVSNVLGCSWKARQISTIIAYGESVIALTKM